MEQMKTKRRITDTLFFFLLGIALLTSCTSGQKDIVPSAEYASYVNAYTGGVILSLIHI